MNLPEQTLSNMTAEELINYNQPVAQTVHALESELENTQDELRHTQECLDEAEDSLKDAAKAFRRICEMSEELLEDERYVGMNDLERLLVKINMLADAKVDKIGDY